MNPQDYMRKGVQRSAVYHAAAQPADYSDIIKLNSNENPYPLPDIVLQDAVSALQAGHNLYPEDDALTFRQTVSALYGLQPDQVLVGNGAADLMSVFYRAMLEDGETVAMPAPGFTLNRKLASLQGGSLFEVPWLNGHDLPVEGLLACDPKFIILANPNNPTGTTCKIDDIAMLLKRFDGPVIVDEAYVDFHTEDTLALLPLYPNLIILRTFSKSYSSAGIRLGFAFGQADMIAALAKVQNIVL